ncbi:MAG: signal peptidase II [Elusimicrobia bacterium]|nr:signal peptidase II [Elusimicrobiota bacterium]
MRISSALLALLLASPAFAALGVPEGGLPAGRLAVVPVVSARQSTLGTWNILQGFMRDGGSSLPGAAGIASLDAQAGRYAAGALLGRVPPVLWAELMMKKDLDEAERGRIVAAFSVYLAQTSEAAAHDNADVLARLQSEIDAGRLGAADLEDAAAALRGLAAHSPGLRASLSEVASALEVQKSRGISAGVAGTAASWLEGKKPEQLGPGVAGREGAGTQALAPTSPAAQQRAEPLPAPAPSAAPAWRSKLKAVLQWGAPILAMIGLFIGIDWGTKAFAAQHLFTAFHEAAWRAPFMAVIIPLIALTAYNARASLLDDHRAWKWSFKEIRNGRLGWHRGEVPGLGKAIKDHPSLRRAVRLYDISIAMMLGGMLANGIDLLRLGGALDWIPVGRSLMNFADIALLTGLAFFQVASHFFARAAEAEHDHKILRFNTVGFLGLPLVGFFVAWVFGTASGGGLLDVALKNIGYLYLMGFSMLIGISRYLCALVINRYAAKFNAEQDQKKA